MDEKVFKSTITRVQAKTDDLYSLLKINPAVPITKNTNTEVSSIAFEPQRDKYFIPKKKSKLKVQTVRDIRNTFEQDIYESLPIEIEKQESSLLRKIKSGHLKNESTKNLAKSILKLDKPISRSSWQILTNINPENNAHRQQYVLWNGTYIRVNGSRGGGTKFLHKTDLYNNVAGLSKSKTVKPVHMRENKKKNLLETSVNIKFKPGPLSRKFHLDCSYQKHQVGKTELVSLPSPILEVYPSYEHALDSTITNYLQNMRDLDGSVSQTWAELAASAVGSVKNGKLRKLSQDVIKFELNYKNGQGRILMRNNGTGREDNDFDKLTNSIENDTETEVKNMLNDIMTSVEVSLKQDHFCIDDEPRSVSELDINLISGGETMKDKAKKKYCELDRLDVTVIRLSDQGADDATKICKKSYCNLGCICSSLECCNYVKGHCRRIECMFECKCDFSKFAHYEKFPEILSQLVNLDREISGKLAKEEQKFHQTVVMTGDKSIVLKGESRNLKTPQKYADFYKNMCLKNKIPSTRALSVVSLKLNCQNVEPWCMVHKLYKCFCKGKFIESNFGTENIPEVKQDSLKTFDALNTEEKYNTGSENEFNKRILRTSSHGDYRDTPTDNESNNPCSRVLPYSKRKYNLDYYKKLSRKIVNMESNDIKLQKRLAELSCKNRHSSENTQNELIRVPTSTVSGESIDVVKQCQTNENHQHNLQKRSNDAFKLSSILIDDSDSDSSSSAIKQSKKVEGSEKWEPKNKTLVKWLENSYKKYKKEIELGIEKTSLDPPKAGTMTLYAWDFILNRYRGRKNLFLVSKSPPYRIFIAVNTKHPLFENCINIDEIRYADLHKYPNTVRNLLSNANDLTNHFFIFRGLKHCWELVGSVSKVDDKSKESDIEIAENESPKLSLDIDDGDSCNDVLAVSNVTNTAVLKQDMQQDLEIKKQNNVADSSKWFVMTIANDFSEIQFYKKGFFVKYESIIKAINVSRSSGNTVRLSSVQQSDPNSTPHFGIYAIPRVNEYCVFIGPYEKDEPLGIEIIKTYSDTLKAKRTRGVWITTKKVDNLNVIDNPLDYMPILNKALQEEVQNDSADQDLHSEPEPGAHSDADIPDATSSTNTSNKESGKKLTRIVIRKTNGFFKILPQAKAKQADAKRLEACENPDELSNQLMEIPKTSEFSNIRIKGNQITKRPIAEIAPQVKESKNKFARMSILKPEEINKKVLEKAHISKQTEEIENDIEDFLATSVVCAPPATLASESFSEVFLECKTVKDLGYIKGKLQDDKFLSFQFPGFKFSPYYEKDEAIEKINQVLSRKVYVPKHINLEWKIATSQDELICKTILNPEELGSDMVLTTSGLLHKKHLLNSKLTDIFDDDVEINASLEITSEDEV